ncbi:MAG TPA: D-alanine--D-alanine ligase family protein [Candidatus Xenobia bacterium]|nr:D-alanine--D-alanine ligase family protein [Candidatus Xenobia bacterium]
MAKLRVGVLFGGRSAEHEVSLVSASSVLRGLNPKKYEVIPIGIGKDGHWVLPRQLPSSAPTHSDLRRALADGRAVSLPPEPGSAALVRRPAPSRSSGLAVDVIFPVLHGTFGEDGTVQGLLELADIPYVGAGVLGSALGMDKEVQKRLFLQAKLPVADFVSVLRRDWQLRRRAVLREVSRRLRFPVFVKPSNLGSSVGITKVSRAAGLPAAIEHAFEFDRKILVEQGILGREIEVSVLGNDEPRASLPGEVIPAREFYDYTAKYLEDTTRFLVPARLTRGQTRRFQELAVAAFRALDCAGMARVDFLMARRTGRIYLNEVNTIPGFTAISMYPKLWEASGVPYSKLLDSLIELALERHREKRRTRFSIELPRRRGGVLKE